MLQIRKMRLNYGIFQGHISIWVSTSRCVLLNNHSHFCLLHYAPNDRQERAKGSTAGSPGLPGVGAAVRTTHSQLHAQQQQATLVRHVTVPWAFSHDVNHFCVVLSPPDFPLRPLFNCNCVFLVKRWFYHPSFCKRRKQDSKS